MQGRKRELTVSLSKEEIDLILKLQSDDTIAPKVKERAYILYYLYLNKSISEIMSLTHTSKSLVYRIINKYLNLGLEGALYDLKRDGRKSKIKESSLIYLKKIAKTRPYLLDKSIKKEYWSLSLLLKYLKAHAAKDGHKALSEIKKTHLFTLLKESNLQLYLKSKSDNSKVPSSNFLFKYMLLFIDKSSNNFRFLDLNTSQSLIKNKEALGLYLYIDLKEHMLYSYLDNSLNKDSFYKSLLHINKQVLNQKMYIILKDRTFLHKDTLDFIKEHKLKIKFALQDYDSYALLDSFITKFIATSLPYLVDTSYEGLINKFNLYINSINNYRIF